MEEDMDLSIRKLSKATACFFDGDMDPSCFKHFQLNEKASNCSFNKSPLHAARFSGSPLDSCTASASARMMSPSRCAPGLAVPATSPWLLAAAAAWGERRPGLLMLLAVVAAVDAAAGLGAPRSCP
eukprot:703212-Pelagomonas_calceolata.AAC.2